MTKLFTIIIFFITSLNLNAQTNEAKHFDKKIKFGVVKPEEFNTKAFGKDSLASAVELFDFGTLHFTLNNTGSWGYTIERHKRIKIISKDGYSYANFEIPIYHSSNTSEESLGSVYVASYNLENGKVIQNKLSRDEKFLDKKNKNLEVHRYTLSNIKEGSIVEIKYTIKSDFIYSLRSWYFQKEIPCLWSDFTFILPEYFKYKLNLQMYVPSTLVENGDFQENFSGTVSGQSTTGSSERYDFSCKSTLKRWVAENIPAFKNEPFVACDDDYLSKLDFELQSTNFKNDITRNYSSTWESIIDIYKKADGFGQFIKPNNFSRNLVSTILKPLDTDKSKMNSLFLYIQKALKWNGINSDFVKEKSIKNILEAKTGNSAEINLCLLNLLKAAKLNAKPILLSTRDNGAHPGYPLSGKFNYVAVQVQIEGQNYTLDATNPSLSIGYLSTQALNHKGYVMDLDSTKGEWIMLEPGKISKSSYSNIFSINADNQLIGDISNRYTEYSALGAREKYINATNQEEYLKDFKSNKPNLKVNSYNQINLDKLEDFYGETFNVELSDYIEEAGNLLYLNPMLFEKTKKNPFISEERNFPVDFNYPIEENYKFILNIPKGYTIDKLPTPIAYKLDDNSASFSYNVLQSDSQILINSKIIIVNTSYGPTQYFEIKELFKKIVEKQAELIVLKKL
jgi:hypothetical protein